MILTKETKQNYTGIGIYKEGDSHSEINLSIAF